MSFVLALTLCVLALFCLRFFWPKLDICLLSACRPPTPSAYLWAAFVRARCPHSCANHRGRCSRLPSRLWGQLVMLIPRSIDSRQFPIECVLSNLCWVEVTLSPPYPPPSSYEHTTVRSSCCCCWRCRNSFSPSWRRSDVNLQLQLAQLLQLKLSKCVSEITHTHTQCAHTSRESLKIWKQWLCSAKCLSKVFAQLPFAFCPSEFDTANDVTTRCHNRC